MSRFAAEMTLGRLARYLRLLGFDARYDRHWDARRLLALDDPGRILLGRSTPLRDLSGGRPRVWIRADRPRDQLREVIEACGIGPGDVRLFSRCLACNAPAVPAERAAVRDRVPDYVFATQPRFFACPDCGRVFWPGSHVARSRAWIAPLLAEAGGDPGD